MPDAEGRITVAHVLEATAGGTRRYLLDVCLGLPRERFAQTAIVSLERNPGFADDLATLRAAGVEVEVVPMVREISPRADLAALRQLRTYFRESPFDVIHAHSSKAGMLARLAAWQARNPAARVYSPHAFAFTMEVAPWRRRLYLVLERLAGRITDLLVCTCDSERELATRHRIIAPSRAAVVRTGVDLRRFRPTGAGHRVRAELGLPRRHRIVGTVGAMVEQKGHDLLVAAAPLVLREMPHTTFVLVGSGPLEDELRQAASVLGLGRRMVFLGQREDVPELLNAFDLFVMPSRWEGMPYALVEAMAVGVPALGSAIPGIVDLLRPGSTGWLTEPGSPEALARAIITALTDEGQSATMAAAGRELVMREHSCERMLGTLAALYERIVEDRRR